MLRVLRAFAVKSPDDTTELKFVIEGLSESVIAPRDAAKVEDGSRPKTNPRQDFWGRTFLIHTLSTYNYYKNIYIVQQVLKEPHDP
ncbi:MAG: hypothetical protein EAZ59_19210 [Oscillatoriales cyanobacterium]|nr:MAG: hypothetical protein EAZ59_19210 [Oscillatoriales cyanobacterium]